jgi:hypothetical protein
LLGADGLQKEIFCEYGCNFSKFSFDGGATLRGRAFGLRNNKN